MSKSESKVEVLLQNLIIVQLALAGVPGADIRKVAGVQMSRVTEILKVIKKGRER